MSLTHLVICPGHGGIDPTGQYTTAGKQYHFTDSPPFSIYEGAQQRVLARLLVEELTARAPHLRLVSALVMPRLPRRRPSSAEHPLTEGGGAS